MIFSSNDNLHKTIPKYAYLLFDLDNTLFDYDQAEDNALYDTFRDLNCLQELEIIKPAYIKINAGCWRSFEEKKINLDELKITRFRDLFNTLPSLSHLDAQECSEIYLNHLAEQVQLIPGAEEILTLLHSLYQLCLVTNGIARVQHRRIGKSGFGRFFNNVIISEEIGYSKPDPAFFIYTLNMLGNPVPGSVLIIGDNLHTDVIGGMNIGMDGCWYNPANRENIHDISPTYTISKLSDLINILT